MTTFPPGAAATIAAAPDSPDAVTWHDSTTPPRLDALVDILATIIVRTCAVDVLESDTPADLAAA